jgi:hypothetical protein
MARTLPARTLALDDAGCKPARARMLESARSETLDDLPIDTVHERWKTSTYAGGAVLELTS